MVSGCLDNGPKISVTRPTVSMEDGMKLAVDVILYASDLEAMETKVRAAGGTVTVPIFAFPGGRRFHFQDPAGNELAVWSES
jgi:predicted enzyme related to lactoylglutathione lyase